MRTRALTLGSLALAGCASLGGASGPSYQPFAGKDSLDARIKEITDKFPAVAKTCGEEAAKAGDEKDAGGFIEVDADPATGQLSARKLAWKGQPAVEECIAREIAKQKIAPFAGPPVAWYMGLTPPGAPPPAMGDTSKLDEAKFQSLQGDLQSEVSGCEQRWLPPEFGADISVSVYIFPGGKPGAVNTISSTAKDGNFEACAQDVIRAKQFPDLHFDGAVPLSFHFHVGRLNQL